MRNKDTVTCGTAQTASVFRAVDACAPCCHNGTDWNHWDSNVQHGCSGCCHACEGCHTACGTAGSSGWDGARCTRCGNSPCTCTAAASCTAPAMVYEQEHDLCQLHEVEEAIRKGTLFSELYMPMNGECADACGAQLCEGQAEAFAAWELRLYLNTHPCDEQALKLFRKYARKADQPNYAGAFAFDDGCPERWSWTDAPWPWEHNAACENNCCCN